MAKTIEELRTAITELETKIDEDITQTAEVIVAVNTLISKIGSNVDLQAEVDAVTAITTKIAADNPALQKAIDDANAQP